MNEEHPGATGSRSFALLGEMLHTRAELAVSDIETYLQATFASLGLAVAALVLALVAFTFAGVAVIAVFWDTHRILATCLTTTAYVSIALALVAAARRRWHSRPGPLETTLRELQLDREAMRRYR
jgi:uncharacterized membrane protein YqjE